MHPQTRRQSVEFQHVTVRGGFPLNLGKVALRTKRAARRCQIKQANFHEILIFPVRLEKLTQKLYFVTEPLV